MYAGFDHRTTEGDRGPVQSVYDALQSSVAGSICGGGTDIPYALSSMWTNTTNTSTTSDLRGEPGSESNITPGSVTVLLTPSNKGRLKRSMQKEFFAQDVPTSRSCYISLSRGQWIPRAETRWAGPRSRLADPRRSRCAKSDLNPCRATNDSNI